MERVHKGAELRAAADEILATLPTGSLELVATSIQGAGIAAACAALRTEPTTWSQINLALERQPSERAVVVVEPVDPGEGWRGMVRACFPNARVAVPTPAARTLAA